MRCSPSKDTCTETVSAQKLDLPPGPLGPDPDLLLGDREVAARRHRPGELDGLEIDWSVVGFGHEVLVLFVRLDDARSPETMRSSAGSTSSAMVSGRGTKRLAGVAMSKD